MPTSGELKHKGNTPPPLNIGQGKGGGRKSSITHEKAAILIAALGNGLTVKESLLQADLSQDAYERRLKKDEKFRGQIAAAKVKLQILAKAGMAQKIRKGDSAMIRWYLERKCPEEFRPIRDDGGYENPLPAGTTIILPGSKPHPRIIPASESKN
ncbi:MAG: hypothetical protein PHO92_00820 [Candidatus Peribacteraceae bacterium]|nr:hypothetical protein [Candidatus Peribacteraceae bacterium]